MRGGSGVAMEHGVKRVWNANGGAYPWAVEAICSLPHAFATHVTSQSPHTLFLPLKPPILLPPPPLPRASNIPAPPHHSLHFLRRHEVVSRRQRHAVSRHAVRAAQVAALSEGDAQVCVGAPAAQREGAT